MDSRRQGLTASRTMTAMSAEPPPSDPSAGDPDDSRPGVRLRVRHPEVVLRQEFVAEGLDDAAIHAATSHLHRVRRGAYAFAAPRDALERHRLNAIAVALRWKGEIAVSHVSAAVLHGLALSDVDLDAIHVTYARDCLRRGQRHGVRSHDGPPLGGDVTTVAGVPTTNVERTLIDCATSLPLEQALVMTDQALHAGWADADSVASRAAQCRGRTGAETARQVVRYMDARSESPGETRTRLVLVRAGVQVEPQSVIRDHDGVFVARVDFEVAGARVAVEFDGRGKYMMSGDVEHRHWNEKRRNDALLNLGYQIVRVTWRDLAHPARIVHWVQEAVARST